MILYKDKRFITNSEHPDDDWIGNADYVIPDDSELAKKIIRLYPNFEFVFNESGKPVDVIEIIVPAPEEPIPQEEINLDFDFRLACLELGL